MCWLSVALDSAFEEKCLFALMYLSMYMCAMMDVHVKKPFMYTGPPAELGPLCTVFLYRTEVLSMWNPVSQSLFVLTFVALVFLVSLLFFFTGGKEVKENRRSFKVRTRAKSLNSR